MCVTVLDWPGTSVMQQNNTNTQNKRKPDWVLLRPTGVKVMCTANTTHLHTRKETQA